MIFWVKKKKKPLVKRGKKWLSAKSQCHMAGAHALLHEISAFIYIYIYIYRLVFRVSLGIGGSLRSLTMHLSL